MSGPSLPVLAEVWDALTTLTPHQVDPVSLVRRGRRGAEDGAAVDTPGSWRLSGLFWGWVLPEKSQPCGSFIKENQPSWRQSTYLFP